MSDCHEWTKAKVNGYGVTRVGGKNVKAHRVAYESVHGPIADGLQIDHLCRNRACVNPDHLEAVSARENIQRGLAVRYPEADTPEPIGGLAEQFANYQRMRGYSEHTLKRRATTLRSLARSIYPTGLADATPQQVERLLSIHAKPRTRHAYLSDLRAFYRWAYRRSLVDNDPTALIDGVRVPRTLPRPVEHPERITDATNPDTALMVALALYAGLRRADIARLAAEDCHGGHIVVRGGKGGKDRVVPMHAKIASLLAGRTGPLFACNADTVGRRIKQHLASCGITATAHQLRHTFGTELARVSGGDLVLIGGMMGHTTTTTTLGYTQLGGDKGAAAVAAMFGG
jgi:site-specific recombinase XerD